MLEVYFDSHNRLVAFSRVNSWLYQLNVWQMNDSRQFTLIHEEPIRVSGDWIISRVDMDEQLMAISIPQEDGTEICFVSMETMKVERSFSLGLCLYRYESGLLFTVRNNLIE